MQSTLNRGRPRGITERTRSRAEKSAALRAEGLAWAAVGERLGVSAKEAERLARHLKRPATAGGAP